MSCTLVFFINCQPCVFFCFVFVFSNFFCSLISKLRGRCQSVYVPWLRVVRSLVRVYWVVRDHWAQQPVGAEDCSRLKICFAVNPPVSLGKQRRIIDQVIRSSLIMALWVAALCSQEASLSSPRRREFIYILQCPATRGGMGREERKGSACRYMFTRVPSCAHNKLFINLGGGKWTLDHAAVRTQSCTEGVTERDLWPSRRQDLTMWPQPWPFLFEQRSVAILEVTAGERVEMLCQRKGFVDGCTYCGVRACVTIHREMCMWVCACVLSVREWL